MTTAAVTPQIVMSAIIDVLSVFVFGLFVFGLFVFVFVFHSLEIVGELVAFCSATVEEAIITELGVTQLGTIWRSCSK